jgi:predicted lysophospholipase L1 biosynthesis ABC-type transport system permease subunit
MKIRHFACWLLGAWLAGSLFMILVATQNFRSVDRLLAAPAGLGPRIDKMGRAEARTFLRYQVSEQNRWYFETWEKAQLVLGAVLLAALWTGLRDRKIFGVIAAAMFALLLLERFYLTPEIIRLGRLIDFVPQEASSQERDTFWRFHGAYSAVELIKLALGFFLSVRIGFGRNA